MKLWKLAVVFVSIVAGGFSVWGVGQVYESVRGYSWPHVSGTVTSAEVHSKLMPGKGGNFVSYWPEVRYEYAVDDRHITGDRIRFMVRGTSGDQARQIVLAYPPGKTVTVYFDPANTASAVLEPGIWWPMIPILAFSTLLTLLLPAMIYSELHESSLRSSPRLTRQPAR
jgi:hypothetical protein